MSRSCGACSLCCSVLRVDELSKAAGTPCPALAGEGRGCGIYDERPGICRAYRCLWLTGGLGEHDRPDRLGAVLDVVSRGTSFCLEIRLARADGFERSSRLREIAAGYRELMPVRISDVEDLANPDRPFRVLLRGGEEQRVEGERVRVFRDGREIETLRPGWSERWARRLQVWLRRRRLSRARVQ